MLRIGDLVDGKYKILSEIGHGGMSTVYLAINEKANKPWAVKEVRKSCSKDFEILRQSLIVETAMLKKLHHNHLPSIVDVIDYDDNFLIVMDYIEGNTLEKLLNEEGAQPQEKVISWAVQLCDVLEYLHGQKPPIIYRDMKPSNIMLKSDGDVVLIDFGTAREFKEKNTADTYFLGTNGYASPEQFGGMGQTDGRTDIYCLGATMYHLVTGYNPSEPPYEMYPITKWKPELSSGLEKIILKCTRKNPDDRYQTAGELRYALENYRDLETAALLKYKRQITGFFACAAISIVCLVGGIGFRAASAGRQSSDYRSIIHRAGRTTAAQEARALYLEAIATDPAKPEAYHSFYGLLVEDGSFDDIEEEELLRLNASTHQYLRTFALRRPLEYADFCYEIGNAYWFYYIHEESRQSGAVPWFETAMEYYENDSAKEIEYRRSSLYVEIGSFYRKIISAQIEGTDAGMYGEYWNRMMQLKGINDKNPDRELITLRLYREIAGRTAEYAKYLREDGVPKEEIMDAIDAIEKDMNLMENGSTSTVKEEIANVHHIMEGTLKMVNSSYAE